MNDVAAAAEELDRAITQLGALGTQLHTNVGGAPLDERRFAPVFDTVTRLDGAVWIHPTRSPAWPDYPAEHRSKYGIWWSLGWPYETSIWAPWLALALLAVGFASTFVLRARQSASTQLADLSEGSRV
jgi:predicted TIM-barrel fold metal-dependent hydrolase